MWQTLFWFNIYCGGAHTSGMTSNNEQYIASIFPQIGATMTLNCQIEKWKDQQEIQKVQQV